MGRATSGQIWENISSFVFVYCLHHWTNTAKNVIYLWVRVTFHQNQTVFERRFFILVFWKHWLNNVI